MSDDPKEISSPEEAMAALARLAAASSHVGGAPASGASVEAAPGLTEEARTGLRYRNLVEQIPAVVFTAALDAGLEDIYVSPQIEQLLGYSQAEWVSDPTLWYERLHPEDRRKLDREFARGCRSGGRFRANCRFVARDGHIVWVHGEARLLGNARGNPVLLQGVAFDISDTMRAREVIRESLREKETLLKEIHHRVKNNLQVTSSLLKLQAERTVDVEARRALDESQNRVRSMALVHELLYRSKDLSRIDLAQYVADLTRQLFRSHAVDPARIRLETAVAPIALSVDVAIPCGLLLNELISNAFKHAFPDGRAGVLQVQFVAAQDTYELVVRDDGVGLPQGIDVGTGTTLGLRLVRTLAAQLDGRLRLRSDEDGTEFCIAIPKYDEVHP